MQLPSLGCSPIISANTRLRPKKQRTALCSRWTFSTFDVMPLPGAVWKSDAHEDGVVVSRGKSEKVCFMVKQIRNCSVAGVVCVVDNHLPEVQAKTDQMLDIKKHSLTISPQTRPGIKRRVRAVQHGVDLASALADVGCWALHARGCIGRVIEEVKA